MHLRARFSQDIQDILQKLSNTSSCERRNGLVSLQAYLRSGRQLSYVALLHNCFYFWLLIATFMALFSFLFSAPEILRLKEIFKHMFQDQSKVWFLRNFYKLLLFSYFSHVTIFAESNIKIL